MTSVNDRLAGLSPEKRALLEKRMASTPPVADGVAVVACAVRLPGGVTTPEGFWELLATGVDAVTPVPASRWDQTVQHERTRFGAFLERIDEFDAAFFGISPREAALMDPQQRMLLELTWEAFERAGIPADRLAGSQTGVFIGAHSLSADYYLLQLAQRGGLETHASTGAAHSIFANRLSYAFDFRGPSITVDTACSSSLVSLHLACQSLRTRESDVAIAGGANIMLLPAASTAFAKLEMLSARGRCRTFDANADGIARGEGCAVVLLKRLADAERDGDPILGVIRGSAVNQDGASNGLTAPNGPSQEAVVSRALKLAGIAPERVGLVETHGTGTPLGDPVEVEALANVLDARAVNARRLYLGALKTNIGHLEGAAGIVGLIKAVLCLAHRQIPPNLHFTALNPLVRIDGTRFVIPTALTEWRDDGLRVAGVSSFGFGGTNAHVVVEEHAQRAPSRTADAAPREHVLPVSARSSAALAALAAAHAERLQVLGDADMDDYLHTASAGRAHQAYRMAVVGATPRALAEQLTSRMASGNVPQTPADAATAGIVFVFTGQGTHWPAMARDLYETEPVFRSALDEALSAFKRETGRDLTRVLIDAAQGDELVRTSVAQPAIFAVQVALTALWRAWGIEPAAIVGHSVGEVAAAHAAGVLSLDDAVRVVAQRSSLMEPAAGRGRMAQVELAADDVAAAIDSAAKSAALSIAACNGPTSTVVSGDATAVDAFAREMLSRGVAVRALAVDFAFHSAQMEPFRAPLVSALAGISAGNALLPFASTVTGTWMAPGDFGAAYWGRNIRQPVLFANAVGTLLDAGFRNFLEIGPHPSLGAGIVAAATNRGVDATVGASLRRERPARAAMLASVARLYEAGARVDWQRWSRDGARVIPVPTYPWQRHRFWLDAFDADTLIANFGARGIAPVREDSAATDLTYTVEWEPARATAPLDDILASVRETVDALPGVSEVRAEGDDVRALEGRAAYHAMRALGALGAATRRGDVIRADDARARGVAPQHARLWVRLLEIAEQGGMLSRRGDEWIVDEMAPASVAPAELSRVEWKLLERCGAALPDVLLGRTDPLSLLFAEDDDVSATAVYADSAGARAYNGVVRAVVRACTASGVRAPRVLEVGAGTGATSAMLLDVLPREATYTFTDVSQLFLHNARERFASELHRMSFAMLDLERDPREQGFAEGGADIIIASNVVHATANIRRALEHARMLLAPGGTLVLVESVAPRDWLSLTFGLTPGWWRFEDSDVRSRDPLLATDAWVSLLRDGGFANAGAVGDDISRNSVHPQAVIIAQTPVRKADAPVRADGSWLIAGRRDDITGAIANRIAELGGTASMVDAARMSDDVARFARSAGARGIVYCADHTLPASTSMQRAVDVINAATTTGTRVWIVTRSALSNSERPIPDQTALWGLGRSAALEAPQAWGGMIDVADGIETSEAARTIVAELYATDNENQVALTVAGRNVARLTRAAARAQGTLTLDATASYLVTGAFGGLGPRIASWLADCGARHLVLAGRTVHADAMEEIGGLEKRGVRVTTVAVDVADGNAMRRVFDESDARGAPVRGVVHSAAAFANHPIAELDAAKIEEALRAKAEGARTLHELTRDRDMDLFVLFSSITGVLGAKGYAAYAAANQYLAGVTALRASLDLPAVCVHWGIWEEHRTGVGARRGDVARAGFREMPDARAFDALTRCITAGLRDITIADVDWSVALQAYESQGARSFLARMSDVRATNAASDTVAVQPPTTGRRGELANVAPLERRDRVTCIVRDEVARVLGMPASSLDDRARLNEVGLDSLMAVEIRKRLSSVMEMPLPATLTFNHPTVSALSAYLLQRLDEENGTPDAPVAAQSDADADGDVHARLLAELDRLPADLRMDTETRDRR